VAKRVLRTGDREEAEEFITDLYLPVGIDLLRSRVIRLELDAMRLETATVGRISSSASNRMYSRDVAENVHLNIPLRGRVVCQGAAGGVATTTPGHASVFMPGQSPDTTWLGDTTQMCLMLPHSLVERALEQFAGGPLRQPVQLAPVMELTRPEAAGFRHLLGVLAAEFGGKEGLLRAPSARHHLEHLLVDSFLLGHRHNYSEAMFRDASSPDAGVVERARQMVEDDPVHPWTSVSLAGKVHVSVRTLQYAFQRDLGQSPMAYVRGVRLRRAREELAAASGGEETVQAVATRWGFNHMGRFASAYRNAFGELPSETLERARG